MCRNKAHLHEKRQVDIFTLRRCALGLLVATTGLQVDTLSITEQNAALVLIPFV
jgi:hypothetical protein